MTEEVKRKKVDVEGESPIFKDSKFNLFKIIRNVLLVYVIPYYIKFSYNIVAKNINEMKLFNCNDCFLSIVGFSILCYVLVLIIFILSFYKSIISKTLIFILWSVIVYIYIGQLLSACANKLCLINPFMFPPIVIPFIIIFHKEKYFDLTFILLILLPTINIMIDSI